MSVDIDKERRLVKRALKGDIEARNEIVLSFHRMVYKVALRLSQRFDYTIEVDDLAQKGLARCIERFNCFDPKRGIRPITYFVKAALMEMYKYVKDRWVVHIPSAARKNPKTAEQAARAESPVSLSASVIAQYDRPMDYSDFLEAKNLKEPLEDLANKEMVQKLYNAIDQLNSRARAIILFRMQGLTLWEIGQKLGITRERVRQIEEASHRELRIRIENSMVIILKFSPSSKKTSQKKAS